LSKLRTHVKFKWPSATRHISPNIPPTFRVLFLAAAVVTTVRESWQCGRSVSDYIETNKHQTFFVWGLEQKCNCIKWCEIHWEKWRNI